MNELVMIKKETKPKEVMFVADAMAGQELINIASEFNDKVGLTSAIITKLDSDAKGGAALSLAEMLDIKIRFIGTGEKVSDFDLFHPDRMASRILGLGDIESLVEKAEEVGIDESKNERMLRKMMSGKFDLMDLLESMEAMQKMGPLSTIGNMMPGMNISDKKDAEAQAKMKTFQVLMSSMTIKEKKNPQLLKHPKRRDRILKGSGKTLRDYNILLRDFEKSKKQMKQMGKMIKSGKMPGMF
jgi:signal recognition particle subunit SRP54